MKYFYYIVLAYVILAGCNKDEEIVVDNPEDEIAGQFTVIEYLPAPGQFINDKGAGFSNITTMEEACDYARKRLAGNNFVSLGAWGGYIVFKSSKPIANSGGYDFSIAGNAFDSSNEPGIVWVMKDENGNGLPDEEWLELKGSYYGHEGYEKNYSVTYLRPSSDNADIEWIDSNGERGVVKRNIYHKQSSYFPDWVEGERYTLYGSRLPAQTIQNPSTGEWANLPFKWGYVDNDGEDSALVEKEGTQLQVNYFRISDAVDADGKAVVLGSVEFIKVQTAVNSVAGAIGENSTEICGIWAQ